MEVIISNNPKEKEATNNNDTIRFPQLDYVTLEDLPNLKSFCSDETQLFFSNKIAFPVLKSLFLRNLSKITRIWDEQPLSEQEKEPKSSCKLEHICVIGCNRLEYVLPFCMLPQSKNLRELHIKRCRKMEVIISNNPNEKEATNNNDTIRFPRLKCVSLEDLPNLKSLCSDETQLFFSNKDAFPVLKNRYFLDKDLKFLRNETSRKEVSIEECGTSGTESDYNGEELDEDLETPAIDVFMEDEIDLDEDSEISTEECSTSNEESDHNGEELDQDLKTPTKKVSVEECSTSGKENDHNGEELDEDLETLTKEISMEECGTSGQSGKESEPNGEHG